MQQKHNVNSAAAKAAADAEADAAAQLAAAKNSASDRLDDYSEAKALTDATPDEKKAYEDVVAAEIAKINAAETKEAVAAALTAAKKAVDDALAKIEKDRADADAAAEKMAEADENLDYALWEAGYAKRKAERATADEYASDTGKKAISDAVKAVDEAVKAAEALSDDASAAEKNAAADAILEKAEALEEITDEVELNSAAAKAAAEAEADAAAQLAAAKTRANERLVDYSEAKTMVDATKAEKSAIAKVVTEGKAAINAAKDIAAVDKALTNAKKAVNKAVAKIEKDRADVAAAKAVTDMFNKLPVKSKVQTTDEAAIKEAFAAYKALTKVQKKLVTEKAKNRFRNARAGLTIAINKAAALKVTQKINRLPAKNKVKTSNKKTINAVYKEYKSLTKAQKKYVTEKTKNRLRNARAGITVAANKDAAAKVTQKLNNLPEPKQITKSDKDAINEARAAYRGLTTAQKKYVTKAAYNKLKADMNAFKKLK